MIEHARELGDRAEHARLPDRRPGDQGRRPRPARAAGARGARARGGRSRSSTRPSRRSRRSSDISVQVGKTGKLTPVADLDPGPPGRHDRQAGHACTTPTRSPARTSAIGDTVVIQKAGEIIPQVVRVEHDARDGIGSRRSTSPRTARAAAPRSSATRDEVDYRCSNPAVGLHRAAQGSAPLVRPPRRHGHRRPGREADRAARRRAAWSGAWPTSTGWTCRRSPSWSGWARSRPRTWSRRSRRASTGRSTGSSPA